MEGKIRRRMRMKSMRVYNLGKGYTVCRFIYHTCYWCFYFALGCLWSCFVTEVRSMNTHWTKTQNVWTMANLQRVDWQKSRKHFLEVNG